MTLCVGEGVGEGAEVAALPHPAASMMAATITASAAAISLVFIGLIYPCTQVAALRCCVRRYQSLVTDYRARRPRRWVPTAPMRSPTRNTTIPMNRGRDGQPLAIATVIHLHAVLRKAFRDAIARECAASRPEDRGCRTLPRHQPEPLVHELVLSLVSGSSGLPERAVICEASCRYGSLLRLRHRIPHTRTQYATHTVPSREHLGLPNHGEARRIKTTLRHEQNGRRFMPKRADSGRLQAVRVLADAARRSSGPVRFL